VWSAEPIGAVRRATYSSDMSRRPIELSPEFKAMAGAEREALLKRYEECRARSEHHAELADEALREAERYARTIRELGEILELEDQLSLVQLADQLRGERLREIAADVLWRHHRAGDVVHYKEWFELVVADGYRIGGKNPSATFLTQVARIESVERVGRRSGLYRLKTA
jgi:hypothetical protein